MTTMTSSAAVHSGARAPASAIRRILVGTDFSPAADRAIEWSLQLAQANQANLCIAHVIDPAQGAVIIEPSRLQASIDGALARAAERARTMGIEAATLRRPGRAWQTLSQLAESERTDLIIVGAQGRRTLGSRFLGSTADRLIRTTSAPTLVVPADASHPPRGLRTILVAVDFSEESALATSMAVRLAASAAERVRLVLLHIVALTIECPDPDVHMAMPQFWEEAEREAARSLELMAAPLRSDRLIVDVRAVRGYPPEGILRAAREVGADLICLGTHGRGGVSRHLMGSVAERVLHQAERPVLAVRRPDSDEPYRIGAEGP